MRRSFTRFCLTLASLLLPTPLVQAESIGYGSIILVPLIAETGTFVTEVSVHNPNATAITVAPIFYGATGSATATVIACSNLTVQPQATARYRVGGFTGCPITPGSNFGMLKLVGQDPTNRPFAAYARVQSYAGDGFSVEGYRIGSIANSKGSTEVTGLVRASGFPGYQSNCFLGSLNEAVSVHVALKDNTGASLGLPFDVALAAGQYVRILDIFGPTGANLPGGDYVEVRAEFTRTSLGNASYLAFCTVQNNVTFDADFRLAKVNEAAGVFNDESSQFNPTVSFVAGATQDLGGSLLPTIFQHGGAGIEHRWAIYLRHPDWVSCAVTGTMPPGEGAVELIDPMGNIVAGGSCQASFPLTYLGERSTRNNGVNGRWSVRVGGCATDVNVTAYTLSCSVGNGGSSLTFGGASGSSF